MGRDSAIQDGKDPSANYSQRRDIWMVARLIILTGKHQGKKIALREGCKLIVGRDEGVAVRLATSEVSRRHCAIRVRDGITSVEDLGSRNGTQINDSSISKRSRLRQGDILRVGPMLFEFEDRTVAVAGSKAQATSDADIVIVKESTEDSIVNWLAEDEPEGADTDTVVGKPKPAGVSTNAATNDSSENADTDAALDEPDVPPPSRKVFDSIAEEAQDIIRRHLDLRGRD
ncbi:MAG: FHA domain-containing protein [Planctomycetota bacterium]|nr:FHA domain-containing protein [Planctomycetota bacterium]